MWEESTVRTRAHADGTGQDSFQRPFPRERGDTGRTCEQICGDNEKNQDTATASQRPPARAFPSRA